MTYDELRSRVLGLTADWNYENKRLGLDPDAVSCMLHSPIKYNGETFIDKIVELSYADGTSKLMVKLQSIGRDEYNRLLQSDDFMGDYARGMADRYPDIDFIIDHTEWMEVDDRIVEKINEMCKLIASKQQLRAVSKKPLIVETVEDDEDGD